MRARAELTQFERLSDASFLGKLLMLPANVRLDWKVIARYKHSSLFGLIVSNEGNKFYKLDTRGVVALTATFFFPLRPSPEQIKRRKLLKKKKTEVAEDSATA